MTAVTSITPALTIGQRVIVTTNKDGDFAGAKGVIEAIDTDREIPFRVRLDNGQRQVLVGWGNVFHFGAAELQAEA